LFLRIPRTILHGVLPASRAGADDTQPLEQIQEGGRHGFPVALLVDPGPVDLLPQRACDEQQGAEVAVVLGECPQPPEQQIRHGQHGHPHRLDLEVLGPFQEVGAHRPPRQPEDQVDGLPLVAGLEQPVLRRGEDLQAGVPQGDRHGFGVLREDDEVDVVLERHRPSVRVGRDTAGQGEGVVRRLQQGRDLLGSAQDRLGALRQTLRGGPDATGRLCRFTVRARHQPPPLTVTSSADSRHRLHRPARSRRAHGRTARSAGPPPDPAPRFPAGRESAA
jgi:hypothetical protein